jgi:hypothetical protein
MVTGARKRKFSPTKEPKRVLSSIRSAEAEEIAGFTPVE